MNTEQREALQRLVDTNPLAYCAVGESGDLLFEVGSDIVAVRPLLQGLLDGPEKAMGSLLDVSRALGLFASAIKSGEPWTASCEEAKEKAYLGLRTVSTALIDLQFDLKSKTYELEIADAEIARLNDGGN